MNRAGEMISLIVIRLSAFRLAVRCRTFLTGVGGDVRIAGYIPLVLGAAIAGCAGQRLEVPATGPAGPEAVATAPANGRPEALPPGIPVRVGDRDILYLTGVTAHLPRKQFNYVVARQPPSTSSAASEPGSDTITFCTLTSRESGGALAIVSDRLPNEGRQAAIFIESKNRLPALTLTALLPADVYPSRYRLPRGPRWPTGHRAGNAVAVRQSR